MQVRLPKEKVHGISIVIKKHIVKIENNLKTLMGHGHDFGKTYFSDLNVYNAKVRHF